MYVLTNLQKSFCVTQIVLAWVSALTGTILTFGLSAQQTVGVFQVEADAYEGYTLIAPNSSRDVYLIDNCGREMHRWETNFNPGVSTYLLPDGNLLRTGRVGGTPFQGGGIGGQIQLLDWDSQVLWSYRYANDTAHQHHDVEPLPNGNILVLAWEYKSRNQAIANGRDSNTILNRLWPEQVFEIKPIFPDSAEIVWEWHLWDHLIQDYDSTKANFGVVADHPELVDINYTGGNPAFNSADWVHANSVQYNAELDQILLSSRIFSEIWVIDHSTTTAEAASHNGGQYGMGGDLLYRWGNPVTYDRGTDDDRIFFGQHDARWIPPGFADEGKIMVFNNGWGRQGGLFSSVDIIDPPYLPDSSYLLQDNLPFQPDDVFWSYTSPTPNDLYSLNVSGAMRLPNGNTLVCEGDEGHLLEITSNLNVVWDYVNPVSSFGPVAQFNSPMNNSLFRAVKYPVDYPAFDGKSLEPGDPIEFNPLDIDCPFSTSIQHTAQTPDVRTYPNPFSSSVLLTFPEDNRRFIEIRDAIGKVYLSKYVYEDQVRINTSSWPNGIYFLYIHGYPVKKMIKH